MILTGNTSTVSSPAFVSAGEVATDCDSTPTCTVTRANGTILAAAAVAQSDVGSGIYQATLTAAVHCTRVDVLTLTWTGLVSAAARQFVQTVEVVGAHYFTIPELRAMKGLEDTGKFPTTLLVELRAMYEEYIAEIVGTSFVPRYQRDLIDGNGANVINLSRQQATSLIGVTINGDVIDTAGLTLYQWGQLRYNSRPFQWPTNSTGGRNVVVEYVHGYPAPPVAVKREVMKAVRSECLASKSSDTYSVIRETYDGRTLQFSTPDPSKGRPTGILTLDPVLVQYNETTALA